MNTMYAVYQHALNTTYLSTAVIMHMHYSILKNEIKLDKKQSKKKLSKMSYKA